MAEKFETEHFAEKFEKPKFLVGDKVIGNRLSNQKYSITREGWVGEVMRISEGGEIIIVKGPPKMKGKELEHDVLAEYFDLLEPKKEEGAPLEKEAPMTDKKRERKTEHSLPIEIDEKNEKVYVIETEIPLNKEGGKLVPQAEKFRHFTLDKKTLQIIEKVATAVELEEPCLLEGETSTSKTSSIEYLGMITGNEVDRMNLNGQTDTSELIGKHVPNDGQLQIEFEQLVKNVDLLNQQSGDILQKANKEGRGLSLLESQKIAKIEGIKVPDWRWQNGKIPVAMIEGRWIILDEINLAEPQILERINSALEEMPSLTLSENGDAKIGKGGNYEVHPKFRIFATMNPAEYAGRQPMSPAYKDRWTSYKFVERPEQKEYAAMMELMIYGNQPEAEIRGKKYRGGKTEPMFKTLKDIPNFRGFNEKLAKFQVTIEDLARRTVIGKNRKEQYMFTRRGLKGFLTALENKTFIDRKTKKKISVKESPKEAVLWALQYYYLDKITNPDDLQKVKDQLDAIGISESNWTHEFFKEKKEEPEARDPEEFFKDFFMDYTKEPEEMELLEKRWGWTMSSDGKLISMGSPTLDPEYVDKTIDEIDFKPDPKASGYGIDRLLGKLRGKKVLSLQSDLSGNWYLEVIEKEPEFEEKKDSKEKSGKKEEFSTKAKEDKEKKDAEDKKETRKYKADDGRMIEFDISRKACEPYGFFPGDRIEIPEHGPATVIGVCEKTLWYHRDNAEGATCWSHGGSFKEDLIKAGIELIKSAEEK